MITRRDLVNALGRHGVADWVVLERAQDRATIDEAARVHRAERRLLWQVTVHVDSPAGRGSAHVTIDAVDGAPAAMIDQAVALADSSIGPVWLSRPLAAPARVALDDSTLAEQHPSDVVADLLKRLKRPATVSARATMLREHVEVVARQGFHTQWDATQLSLHALVATSAHALVVERHARQLAALGADDALAQAKQDLDLLASATAPSPGPCALVLGADALLHGGLGVWAAFASQADAVVERQGLTRYREHKPIAPGADQVAEPLTIISNGARDHGLLSAPLGDRGGAVRRFALVERGIAAGLGLTPREGALRGRDPNGGVRNLEVALGSWPGAIEPGAERTVEVRRLRSLAIDPYTGDATLEIALGIDHDKGGARPFTGGALRLDLIAALAAARRSSHAITRGAYHGPDAVWIEHAELLG